MTDDFDQPAGAWLKPLGGPALRVVLTSDPDRWFARANKVPAPGLPPLSHYQVSPSVAIRRELPRPGSGTSAVHHRTPGPSFVRHARLTFVPSVLRRPVDRIDDQDVKCGPLRFQLQAQLLLQSREQHGFVAGDRGSDRAAGRGRSAAAEVVVEAEIEVVHALELREIGDRTIERRDRR